MTSTSSMVSRAAPRRVAATSAGCRSALRRAVLVHHDRIGDEIAESLVTLGEEE